MQGVAIENKINIYKKITDTNTNFHFVHIAPEIWEKLSNLNLQALLGLALDLGTLKERRADGELNGWSSPYITSSYDDLHSLTWSRVPPSMTSFLPLTSTLPSHICGRGELGDEEEREQRSVLSSFDLIHRWVSISLPEFEPQFNTWASLRMKFPHWNSKESPLMLAMLTLSPLPSPSTLTFNMHWSESCPQTPALWLGQPPATRPTWANH